MANEPIHVVDPSGHIVQVNTGQPLKAGWRVATEDDIAAAEDRELLRRDDVTWSVAPAAEAADESDSE